MVVVMADDRPTDGQSRTIGSVHRACAIIGYLMETDAAGVTEIADALEFSKGTVHNHLSTLYEQGFIQKDHGTYRLGYKFVEIGEKVKRSVPIYEMTRRELSRLAKETGEYTQLMIEDDGMGIYLIKIGGENAIGSDYHVGERQYLHYSAAGKAILAHLPDEHVDQIVDQHGLTPLTEYTVTEKETLYEQLESVRERGFALSDQETAIGIRAVGAPILNRTGKVLGAISISGPVRRIPDDEFESEFPDMLMQIANIIEIHTHYHQ